MRYTRIALASLALVSIRFSVGHAAPSGTEMPVLRADAGHIDQLDRWLYVATESGDATRLPPSVPTQQQMSARRGVVNDVEIGNNRIVGGEYIDAWQSIGVIRRNSRVHCTGTVVAPNAVLTAAHCVCGFASSGLTFGTGADGWRPVKEYKTAGYTFHHDYRDDVAGLGDVAILYLADAYPESIDFELPTSTSDVDRLMSGGPPLAFVGYGYAVSPDGVRYRLGAKARVDMLIQAPDPALVAVNAAIDKLFQYGVAGKNTCNGDSGGPAIWFPPAYPSVKAQLIGVTSYGDRPCLKYGVDVRVDRYVPWIREQVKAAPPPSDAVCPVSSRRTSDACAGHEIRTRTSYNACINRCNDVDPGQGGNGCRDACNGKRNAAVSAACYTLD